MKRIALLALATLLVPLSAERVFAEKISHQGVTADPDSAARECLSCHDGMIGPCNFKGPHAKLPAYPPKGKEREFSTTASITAAGVRLDNGRLTCISCHDLRGSGKNHLIKAGSGNEICGLCHIKH
jgi:predicted CXXCH cytochrome family protein